MKRILCFVMAAMMALGLGAAFAESTEETETAVALDPREVFDEATGKLLGADYELLCLADTAELADGRLFGFLCRVTAVVPNAAPRLAIATVFVDGERKATLLDVTDLPFTDENGDPAAITAEYLFHNLMMPIAVLPEDTVGASLKRMQRVADLWSLCAAYDFTAMDAEAIRRAEADALTMLTEAERAAYAANAPAIYAEAARLADPEAATDGICDDAGVAGILEVLRGEAAVRASMEAFLAAVTPGTAK